ncbi:MAG TPA: alpha/beta hydrolase [Anaerolineae bacterium]|nr:alpha/beta hydrolase [Anaerolineae bacterium]
MSEDKFAQANGLKFHAIDWGGRGEPIVLLHGLASQAHIWDLVAPQLLHTFRVVAIDQRGHGLTDQPETGYDFATITRDLDQVLTALEIERAMLIGHSWGGNVAVQYAIDHPERVSGLVLVDGGFLQVPDRIDWPTAEKLLEPPDLIGTPVDVFRANLKFWLGAAWTPEAETITLNNFEVRADNTIAPRLKKSNHMQVVRALYDHRPSELWTKIACPVFMVPAVAPPPHDARTQDMLDAKRRNIALAEQRLNQSRTIWMNDTIHDIPLQRPAELAEAIKALAAQG